MKKLLLLLSITSLTTFIPQLHSISLADYTQQHGVPQVQDDPFGALLDLSNKNLTDLTGLQDIPGIDQVTILHLSNNKLQTLPENIFGELQNLEELYLDNNQLKTLPDTIFNNLRNLVRLDLSDNELKTLPENIFHGLHNLGTLDLRNNQLKNLPVTIFKGLQSLSSLHLDNNQLKMLPDTIFHGLKDLDALYLNSNKLETLPDTIFSGLHNLRTLDLRGNSFNLDFIATLTNIIKNTIPKLTSLNNKPIDQALKQVPFSTLKESIVENIAKNLDKYRPTLHKLPSDILDLLPLTPQQRAEINARQVSQ